MFCIGCGKKVIEERVNFCPFCGKKQDVVLRAPVARNTSNRASANRNTSRTAPVKDEPVIPLTPVEEIELTEITKNEGQGRSFPFLGDTLIIPRGMDSFIEYRKGFKQNARILQEHLAKDYEANIRNLDQFFVNFPNIYCKYRARLIDSAVRLIIDYDIFDISREEFEAGHNADFGRCNEVYETMITAFNNTITKNQNNIAKGFSMIPGFIFSGIGGAIAATVFNVATEAAFEVSIKKANVSFAQRKEIFGRIKTELLYEDVFYDYWNVHYSLCWQLNQRGLDMWYPTAEGNKKAEGLMNNLKGNLVPKDKIVPVLIQIFQARPQQDGLFEYLNDNYHDNPDVIALNEYFGYDHKVI